MKWLVVSLQQGKVKHFGAFGSRRGDHSSAAIRQNALAARREHETVFAQRLLRELKEQYPDNVLFASEYAKAMDLSIPASPVPIVWTDSTD